VGSLLRAAGWRKGRRGSERVTERRSGEQPDRRRAGVGRGGECRLVAAAQRGDLRAAEALLERYAWLVGEGLQAGWLGLVEREDLEQLGRIGLWEAVREFEVRRGVPFSTFARVCVRRQMASGVRKALRQHARQRSLDDAVLEEQQDARASAAEREALALCALALLRARLSPREWRCFRLQVAGHRYDEIAASIGCSLKAVDNALVRVRRKMQELME